MVVLKTASQKSVEKTAELTGDLIGWNISRKITGGFKKHLSKREDVEFEKTNRNTKKKINTTKEKQQVIDKLRLT